MTENSRTPDEEPTGSTAPGSSEAGSTDAATAPQVDADSSAPAAPAPTPAQPAFGYGAEQSGDHSAYAAPAAFGAPASHSPASATQPVGATQPAPAPHAAPTFAAPAEAGASAPGASFGPAAAAPDYAYATAQPGVTGSGAPAPKTRKRSAAVPIIAALAIGAVLGGASGAGVTAATMSSLVGTTSADSARPTTVTVNDSTSVNQTTAVAAKATPSVVTISASSTSAAGTGSGVILDDKGYILTNTHVVTLDGASGDATIEVTLSDGRIFAGKVVGTDPTVDLAVVKIEADDLTPITFGDSDKLNVGDAAIAIGAPLGLSNTVTDGIVSALDRSIQIASSAAPDTGDQNQGGNGGSDDGSPFDFWNNQQGGSSSSGATSSISIPVIQTDASINPGNSGGALVDDEGKLIGINVAIASAGGSSSSSSQSGSIGVGFSIPANLAKRVADEIIANGTATHGLLGASVSDATLKSSSTVGAVIAETPVSGGAAEKAGLQKGDVVTEFDGHPITSATDLTAQVRAEAGGSTAKLTYVRDGRATTVEVTLGTYSS
ncbi:S1C family serine protease [Schumannella sp. 10F1B-5-1]|uniref:S1C family serine protease n=1 Tax=Schumannella sp. 10F1B-5-1 TaxID=2590780 RepID=UPI001130FFDF|nr:trypsin-like peptidase domain-containing protein [Schumannella sp. 10F1B-5-1]TPW73169.1 PDZ domain-containing protein [Schumannella sp. 10F1B-5-1]